MEIGIQRRRHYAPRHGREVSGENRLKYFWNPDAPVGFPPPRGGWDNGTYTCTTSTPDESGAFDTASCPQPGDAPPYTFHISEMMSALPSWWFSPEHQEIGGVIYDRTAVQTLRVRFNVEAPDIHLATNGCAPDFVIGLNIFARCGDEIPPTAFGIEPSSGCSFQPLLYDDNFDTETPDIRDPIIDSPWYTPYVEPLPGSYQPDWFEIVDPIISGRGSMEGYFLKGDGSYRFTPEELNDMTLRFTAPGFSNSCPGWAFNMTILGYYHYTYLYPS